MSLRCNRCPHLEDRVRELYERLQKMKSKVHMLKKKRTYQKIAYHELRKSYEELKQRDGGRRE